jgi:hypothetical protein
MLTAPIALALGALPGFAALTLTPARLHPWRALLILVPATVVGFGIWAVVYPNLPEQTGVQWIWLTTLFSIPTFAGIMVALNINRLPKQLWSSQSPKVV